MADEITHYGEKFEPLAIILALCIRDSLSEKNHRYKRLV